MYLYTVSVLGHLALTSIAGSFLAIASGAERSDFHGKDNRYPNLTSLRIYVHRDFNLVAEQVLILLPTTSMQKAPELHLPHLYQ